MPMRWEREWIGSPVLPASARRNPILAHIAEVKEPQKRAMMLLEEYLTDFQVRDLHRNLGFNVRGSNRRLYRICRLTDEAMLLVRHGPGHPYASNFDLTGRRYLWNNVIDETFHARGCWLDEYYGNSYPEGDVLFAQKLLIESKARVFEDMACGFSVTRETVKPLLHNYGGMI